MDIVTVGDIAKELNINRDTANYAVRKAGIEPIGRAGLVRLFPRTAIERVRSALEMKRSYHIAKSIVGEVEEILAPMRKKKARMNRAYRREREDYFLI